jgi:putative aminopeptidase FrvX
MADRSTTERWLAALTHLPTASGHEDAVIGWVQAWVQRRGDLKMRSDAGGNLLITQKGRRARPPVVAVAHMDHPAFVVTTVRGREADYEFRGGVRPQYFENARVEFTSSGSLARGVVTAHDSKTGTGVIRVTGDRAVGPGDLATWAFAKHQPRSGQFSAPACDDLAGCAAALAALDRARELPALRHFGVLLTRAEEVGFVGAIHAAKSETISRDTRLLSIEASRASSDAPVGAGPVVRVGDASTVFDRELTNQISAAASLRGLPHQRKLMAGGSCEATAFGVYGYRAAGLCLPLGNYHNMGNLDEVEAGSGKAIPMLETVALSDFHSLADLLLLAATAVDDEDDLMPRLNHLYEETRHLLERRPLP